MKTKCLGILAALAVVSSTYAATFQFNSVTTYSQEIPNTTTFTVGLVTHIQGNLPMSVDLADLNEATSFRIGASTMWGGDDFQVLLGQDPAYKPGATKANINTPSGNVQLSWTANNVSFSGVLFDTHSAPSFIGFPLTTPIPLGVNGPFSSNATLSVHFQYFDFTHPATLTGTNKVVAYQTSTPLLPGFPPIVTYVYVNTGKFNITADLVPPTIKFNSPAQNTVVTNGNLQVNVTVSDNVALGGGPITLGAGAVLSYSVNGGASVGDADTLPGITSTTHSIDVSGALTPGTNVITFIAADSSGNLGTNTLTIFFSQKSAITLVTNGVGGITGVTNGQMLEIGRNYTVTAKPGIGKVLSTWQDTYGNVLSRSNKLTFRMVDGLTLTASFADSPFPAVQGTYLGYFLPPFAPDVSQFGGLKMDVSASGFFSGTLSSAAGSQTFSGQFLYESNGTADAFIIATSKAATNSLTLILNTDPTSNNFAVINGRVSVYPNGVKALTAANISAARQTNATVIGGPATFHFAVNAATNDVNFPGGTGFGTLKVATDGSVTGSLSLADGEAPLTTFSSHLVYTGYLPVFVPLYTKGGGFLMTPDLSMVPADVGVPNNSTTATWVKTSGKKFYPNGFSTANNVSIARFVDVPSGAHYGAITLELDPDVLINESLGLTNTAFGLLAPDLTNVKGTVANDGSVSGTFADNGVPRSFKGTVVTSDVNQHTFETVGFFVRSNQTGSASMAFGPTP